MPMDPEDVHGDDFKWLTDVWYRKGNLYAASASNTEPLFQVQGCGEMAAMDISNQPPTLMSQRREKKKSEVYRIL